MRRYDAAEHNAGIHGAQMDIEKFFVELAETGVEAQALRAAGMTRGDLRELKQDAKFSERYDDAIADASDAIELEVHRRSVAGWQEPVVYQGEPVWKRCPRTGEPLLDENFDRIPFTVNRKSDGLLAKLVEAKKPEQFGKKQSIDLTGSLGVNVRKRLDLESLTPEERAVLSALLKAREAPEDGGAEGQG